MPILESFQNKALILNLRLQGKTKLAAEISFWLTEKKKYVEWYNGNIDSHYGVPPPKKEDKIIDYLLEENAIRTWASVHKYKYRKHL